MLYSHHFRCEGDRNVIYIYIYSIYIYIYIYIRAGRYGQNLYHNIFFNFGRYDIIPISIWTLLKKASLKKCQKCPQQMSVLKNLWKNNLPSLWTPPIKLYNILGGGDNTNKLIFTFYLYLAFIQTRNAKSLSNKHLRLTLLILISLTSNYRLTYATSQNFLNSKIFVF